MSFKVNAAARLTATLTDSRWEGVLDSITFKVPDAKKLRARGYYLEFSKKDEHAVVQCLTKEGFKAAGYDDFSGGDAFKHGDTEAVIALKYGSNGQQMELYRVHTEEI